MAFCTLQASPAAALLTRESLLTIVQRSRDRSETIVVRTRDGARLEGVVDQVRPDGFRLLERSGLASHDVLYSQVASASHTKRVVITAVVVGASVAVVVWLAKNCFFHC
jgi:hypothetical protein